MDREAKEAFQAPGVKGGCLADVTESWPGQLMEHMSRAIDGSAPDTPRWRFGEKWFARLPCPTPTQANPFLLVL